MDFNKFNYKVDRTKNCVLIDTNNWVENTSNILKTYKMSGKQVNTYIAKILETNIADRKRFPTPLLIGDVILLTRLVSEIARDREHSLIGNGKYFDIPIMQIIGYFRHCIPSFENLVPIYDKIIMERIDISNESLVSSTEDNNMVCRILKVGTNSFDKKWNKKPLQVKEGDVVLVKDNVTTKINLNNKDYFATEESAIVAIFKDEKLDVESATFINESIILEEYQEDKAFGSSVLVAPRIDYEIVDYTDLYNRDMFKVKYVDKGLQNINKNDILLLNRDLTTYVYINNEKYFLINGTDNVEAKIKF